MESFYRPIELLMDSLKSAIDANLILKLILPLLLTLSWVSD